MFFCCTLIVRYFSRGAVLAVSDVASQAESEGLTLLKADSKAGYFGVSLLSKPGQPKPYQARVWRNGNKVSLGMFAIHIRCTRPSVGSTKDGKTGLK